MWLPFSSPILPDVILLHKDRFPTRLGRAAAMRTVETGLGRKGGSRGGSAGSSRFLQSQVFSYMPRPVRLTQPSFDHRETTCLW